MNRNPEDEAATVAQQLRPLMQAQVAAAVTWASLCSQYAGIAAGAVGRGAERLATLAGEQKPVFPDSYERVAAGLVDDYARAARETAALGQVAALRFAREMQRQRQGQPPAED